MRKIYKYPLKITDTQRIEMPVESKILSVVVQSKDISFISEPVIIEELVVWALVDEENYLVSPKTTIRTIHIIGTSNSIPEVQLNFIGTVQTHNGFVWHIFEEL
jgi:hypothetical protein